MNKKSIIASVILVAIIISGFIINNHFKRQKYYYLVETALYPAPSLILNNKGELVKTIDAIHTAIDPQFGIAQVTTTHDLYYYDTNGKLRFHLNTPKNIHHAVVISPKNGDVYFIANEVKDYFGTPALIDSIERYSKEGVLMAKFDVFEKHQQLFDMFKLFIPRKYQALGHFPLNPLGYAPWGSKRELFHFNYLQVIPSNENSGIIPGFEAGNILLTMPYYGSFLALDAQTLDIRWSKSLALDHMPRVEKSWMMTEDYVTGFIIHSGSILENGNISYFRNQDFLRTMLCDERQPPQTPCTPSERNIFHGAALEFNPLTNNVLWAIETNSELDLDTIIQGSVFVTPDDHLLVTVSDKGTFYRLNKNGEILYQYHLSRDFTPETKTRIYRTLELSESLIAPLLFSAN